jgi:adenylate cyclase
MRSISELYREVRDRRVARTAILYGIVGFGVAQVADLVLPALMLPDWTLRFVIVLLLLGFPIALVLAWSFDVTAEGVRRARPPSAEGGRGVSRSAVLVGLGVVISLVAIGGFYGLSSMSLETDDPVAARAEGRYAIAVLPLMNMAGGEDNEYFADGITEDILSNLGLVPNFTVISRTSVMRYKASEKSVPEIARELGVQYVLEGSMRRVGDQVRVVMQLIEAGTDVPIWAQTLDRRVEDVFALQSEVARAVVDALRVELTSGVDRRLGRAPTEDIAAYELFIQARDHYYRYSATPMEEAIGMLRQAVVRDPQFALAHAWLASAYAVSVFNYGADARRVQLALQSARTALRLQPDLADAHRALGVAYSVAGQIDEGTRALERTIALNPNDFTAFGNLGLTYSLSGRLDEALELMRRTIAIDPVRSYIDHVNVAGIYNILGMDDAALRSAQQALALRADFAGAHRAIALVDLRNGRRDAVVARLTGPGAPDPTDVMAMIETAQLLLVAGEEARARQMLHRSYELSPTPLPKLGASQMVMLAELGRRSGETDRADRLFEESRAATVAALKEGQRLPELEYNLAAIAALRGDRSGAIDHLERAVALGWRDSGAIRRDPLLVSMREDRRVEVLLRDLDSRLAAMRSRVPAGS